MSRLVVAPMATRFLFWKKVQSLAGLRQRLMDDRALEGQLRDIAWAASAFNTSNPSSQSQTLKPRQQVAAVHRMTGRAPSSQRPQQQLPQLPGSFSTAAWGIGEGQLGGASSSSSPPQRGGQQPLMALRSMNLQPRQRGGGTAAAAAAEASAWPVSSPLRSQPGGFGASTPLEPAEDAALLDAAAAAALGIAGGGGGREAGLLQRLEYLMGIKRSMAEAHAAHAHALAAGEGDWVDTPSVDEEQEVRGSPI